MPIALKNFLMIFLNGLSRLKKYEAGFEIDSPVKVRIIEECLVLTSEP